MALSSRSFQGFQLNIEWKATLDQAEKIGLGTRNMSWKTINKKQKSYKIIKARLLYGVLFYVNKEYKMKKRIKTVFLNKKHVRAYAKLEIQPL